MGAAAWAAAQRLVRLLPQAWPANLPAAGAAAHRTCRRCRGAAAACRGHRRQMKEHHRQQFQNLKHILLAFCALCDTDQAALHSAEYSCCAPVS